MLDETTDFYHALGNVSGEIHIFCRSTERLNSFGVRNWMRFFEQMKRNGNRVKFFECSVSLVRLMNMFHNLPCGGEVISVCLPYFCQHCAMEYDVVMNVNDLKNTDFQVPKRVCTACGGLVVFDEVPQDYFEVFKTG